ncbi:MAG: hypothetical protein EXR66_00825 [Dehalococcoidia bacterium]|nr:hypothetical protein [Dehalococcoidia bacterium]
MSEATEPATPPADLDHRTLAQELAEERAAFIEALRTLPESRAYRASERVGWTLKHELSALGAADTELLHVLDELRRRSGTLTLELRRRRAETMHSLQSLRLTPLIERLTQDGARALEALAEHGHELARMVHIERPAANAAPAPATSLAHAYRERIHRAIAAVNEALGR